ncbi:L-glyceraldehyde 3-phosphate reductase [Timonella sp. A28]|uniref:L-glyceraldehyde 3-phosphate reductase n=1 Tax=Timonella sp. A28 TaxID=3442640 RepID=UPI003EC0E61D
MSHYTAQSNRYETMPYRRTGRSGLDLPSLSLGLWHNFGDTTPFDTQRNILRRAFDLGVTHFDLANNYGPPYGSAEENFGRHLKNDFRHYRDELIISSKAGYDMWPGPYGDGGSRKYLLSSLDQSLTRMGLDYVDIFYSHRYDEDTPLEETMGALHTAVTSGKALYAGVSNYTPEQTQRAARILADLGTPLLIHQPSYSMFNRHVEQPDAGLTQGDNLTGKSLLETVDELGIGMICFSPLSQGLLTNRYLDGNIPSGSRASIGHFLKSDKVDETYLGRARGLNEIAAQRGQSLAQLALSWILRDSRVTSVLVGASSVNQLEDTIASVHAPTLGDDEIAAIEQYAIDGTGR